MVKIKFIKGVFLVLSFLAICSISYASALRNPGFESGEDDWYNWNDGESNGVVSSEFSHNGNNSARRDINGVGQGAFGQIIAINPGDTIKAGGWVMNPNPEKLEGGAEAFLRIEFWNEQGPLSSGHVESVHITEPTTWKKIEVTATAPPGAKEARALGFVRGASYASKGKVYFDDFEIDIEREINK